jgi:hypothetical protein
MRSKRHVRISSALALAALTLGAAGCGSSGQQPGHSLASTTPDPCQVYLHGQDTRVKIEFGGGEAGCKEVAGQWSTQGLVWSAGQPPAPQGSLKLVCAMRAHTGLTLTVQDSRAGYGNELCQTMASKGFTSIGSGTSTSSTSTLQFGSGT